MRRPMLGFLAATWLAGGLLAGAADGAGQQDLYPETLRIRGEVLVEGGGPLSGARIRTDALRGPNATQIVAQREFTARTGRSGDWSLLGITRGLWILEVSALDHLPHVVVVPISMMTKPDPRPWETSLSLLPAAAMGPVEGAAINAPQRLILDGITSSQAKDRPAARVLLAKLAEMPLESIALCAAGDLALLIREPAIARRFFDQAAKVSPDWYRPHLGLASAAMMSFDLDAALKGYADARARTKNEKLTRMLSASVRELQHILRIG